MKENMSILRQNGYNKPSHVLPAALMTWLIAEVMTVKNQSVIQQEAALSGWIVTLHFALVLKPRECLVGVSFSAAKC